MEKKWLSSTKVINKLNSYEKYYLGVTYVDPKDIISLSISLEDAKNDQKAKDLKESVKKNGWLDCDPKGITTERMFGIILFDI